MKKAFIIVFVVVFAAVGLGINGFAQEKPQYGGIMKRINPTGARTIGYYPEMGPQDSTEAFPAIERVMEMTEERTFEPFLADSVNVDRDKMTITFHLKKGIKFHDGSDFNAESCAWNYQLQIDKNKIQFGENIERVEIADEYTMILHIKEYHNQLIFAYGWVPQFSKAAFEKNGMEWCRTHPVGTGPFKFEELKRDVHLKYTRFEDYWQKGKPYLDGIETRYIPDAITASMMMRAGEADIYTNPPIQQQDELVKAGLERYTNWPALPIIMYINTADPSRPVGELKVREALEYAIDKPALAKVVGLGYYPPLKLVAPETEWGYDPSIPGREYNPEKARNLLAEAGYPKGVELKLLVVSTPSSKQVGEAVKAFLEDAGFQIDLDLADPGRFYSSVFGNGWQDLAIFFTGLDENYLATIQAWFGHEPKTNLTSFKRPDGFIKLSQEAVKVFTDEEKKEYCRKMVKYIHDNALMIPLYNQVAAYVHQPWLHTDYYKTGFIRWKLFDTWMEKH